MSASGFGAGYVWATRVDGGENLERRPYIEPENFENRTKIIETIVKCLCRIKDPKASEVLMIAGNYESIAIRGIAAKTDVKTYRRLSKKCKEIEGYVQKYMEEIQHE